jgi:hypothetical protein
MFREDLERGRKDAIGIVTEKRKGRVFCDEN